LADSPLIHGACDQLSGTIMDYTRELSEQNEILVEMDLMGMDEGRLSGSSIYIPSRSDRNAVYRIERAICCGLNRYILSIGDISLIQCYSTNAEHADGPFKYDISTGDHFVIPLAVSVSIDAGNGIS